MGYRQLKLGMVVMCWLLLQPVFIDHHLAASLPHHNQHECVVCALHLDGTHVLLATPWLIQLPPHPFILSICVAPFLVLTIAFHYSIRAPPKTYHSMI